MQRAEENGVEDVAHIGAAQLKRLESDVKGTSALVSGSTGIVDSHALMLSYQADAEAAGATVAFRTPVLEAAIAGGKIGLTTGGSETAEIEADLVVNAAGLDAWDFSARLRGLDGANIPPRFLAKGNYFTVSGVRSPFRHLIYPVPEPGGLGIHLTFDLAGQVRFGPDVEWVDHIDYAVDPGRGRKFYAAIRRYWPDLPDGVLGPAYAGIRPKTAANGSLRFRNSGARRDGAQGIRRSLRDRVAGTDGLACDRRARRPAVRAWLISSELWRCPNGLPLTMPGASPAPVGALDGAGQASCERCRSGRKMKTASRD